MEQTTQELYLPEDASLELPDVAPDLEVHMGDHLTGRSVLPLLDDLKQRVLDRMPEPTPQQKAVVKAVAGVALAGFAALTSYWVAKHGLGQTYHSYADASEYIARGGGAPDPERHVAAHRSVEKLTDLSRR